MWTQRRSGHTHQRGHLDQRNPYERDKTRVIHCPAFRRLQRKTQILGTDEGDFHRTRLTHSLEVASIGASIVRSLWRHHQHDANVALLPDDDLIAVICLLHDIGHPPFGHGGEVALNYMMRDHGGFEGNAQTLRLLSKVETSYGEFGLDLTRRSLLGILKYPVPWSTVVATTTPNTPLDSKKTIRINDWLPPKAYFDAEQAEVDWLLSPFQDQDKTLFQSLVRDPGANQHGHAAYHSFDCSIMDIADDIAYGVHDLEDAIHLRLIRREQFDSAALQDSLKATPWAKQSAQLLDRLFSHSLSIRKEAIGELVNYFITAVEIVMIQDGFEHPILQHNVVLNASAQPLLSYCKACIYRYVIDSQEARTFEYGGQKVVTRLFDAFSSNPENLLDAKNRELYQAADQRSDALRVICDYIANMTDEYAHRMHERLFGFNTRTIFERL
ncbi:MAG: anti-phage deoxyguanosine triphosphatase [Gammaproteobacteria bacterium]|nr:anti-phage deoxyguanosine triphosphatase [Gammaproteobacteria bacterium]